MQICVFVWRICHFVNKCVIKIIGMSADPVACLREVRGKMKDTVSRNCATSDVFRYYFRRGVWLNKVRQRKI